MATNYPTSLDTATQQPSPSASDDLNTSGLEHDVVHTNHSGALIQLETKLGIGASAAADASDGHVMTRQADGSTAWEAVPTNAATVTVADTTDTTCSVALFESATGDLAPKTDGGATYNASTGVLTATGFAGTSVAVTGAITGGSVVAPIAFNAQTGTTYTFVAGDAGKMVTSSNGSAQTFTVPPNSSVAFDVGTQIIVQNIGSANCTLAQGSGVTITSVDSNKEIDGQYASAVLIKTATDAWTLIGKLK